MAYYEIACRNRMCKHPNDISELICLKCGRTIKETPNVRRAILPAEQHALKERYSAAKKEITRRGVSSELAGFEDRVLKDGKAIINIDFSFLWKWLMDSGTEYKSYQRQIYEGLRSKAKWANDVKRCIVDAFSFWL